MATFHRLARTFGLCIAVLFVTTQLTSCTSKVPKVLQGTWGIDHEAMIQDALKEGMSPQEKEFARVLAQTLQFNLRLDRDHTYEFYISTADEHQVSTGTFRSERIHKQRAQLTFESDDQPPKYAYIQLQDEDRFLLQFTPEKDQPFDPNDALPIRRLSHDVFDQHTQTIIEQRDAQRTPPAPAQGSEHLLYGAWLLQNEATLAQLPKDQQAAAATWIEHTQLGMIFSPDYRLEMHLAILGDNEYTEGRYQVLEAEPDRLALQMITDGEAEDGEIVIAVFLDKERMLLSPVVAENEQNPSARAEPLILKRSTKKELYKAVNQNQGMPTLKSLGLE